MTKQKRIILTVTNDLVYDQRMQKICRSLTYAGYDVELVGRERRSSPVLSNEPYEQTRLICFFEKGKLFYIEFNLRLFFYLLFTRFNAICAIDLDTIAPAFIIGKLKGAKLIYDAHEYFTEVPEVVRRPSVKKTWEWIEKTFVPKADLIYTVSPSLAELFTKKYNKQTHTILNVPDNRPQTTDDGRQITSAEKQSWFCDRLKYIISFLLIGVALVFYNIIIKGIHPIIAAFLSVLIIITVYFSFRVRNNVKLSTFTLFALSSLTFLCFAFGFGILFGNSAIDIQLHDTMFVISHSHILLLIAFLMVAFAAIYRVFRLDEKLGKVHFWITITSVLCILFPMHWMTGLPRRYCTYSNFETFNNFNTLVTAISIMAIILLLSQVLLIFNLIYSLFKNPKLSSELNRQQKTTAFSRWSNEKYILYQGALNEGRGLEHLIEAMPQINCKLKLAGEGDLSSELRSQVKHLNLEDKIEFLGYIKPDALKAITANATIGINLLENKGLSYFYSLSNKFLDYIHASVPQVCIAFPEYKRLNDEYNVALLIENCSPEEIKAVVNRLLTDREMYLLLQKNCEVCSRVLNWHEEEKKLLALYGQLFR